MLHKALPLVRQGLGAALLTVVALPAAASGVWKQVAPDGSVTYSSQPMAGARSVLGAGQVSARRETAPSSGRRSPEAQLAALTRSPYYPVLMLEIADAARRHRVDAALLKAIAATESALNPLAVSPKGAVGLMQIMPATGADYLGSSADMPIDRVLFDPVINIDIGAQHLARLLRRYPDRLDLVLAAYNAGEGAVSRAGNRVPPFRETREYVNRVQALYAYLSSSGNAHIPF